MTFPDGDATFAWEFSDGSTDSGQTVTHTFDATLPDQSTANPIAQPVDPIEVTLRVTAPDGRTATVRTTFALAASLWATLWDGFAPFRRRPDDEFEPGEDPFEALSPGFFATRGSLDFLKYRFEYRTTDSGVGQSLRLTYKTTQSGRFRFVEPEVPGQGDTQYELPIDVSLSNLGLTGDFGSTLGRIVEVKSITTTMLYTRRYQAGVQTSERRLANPASETLTAGGDDGALRVPSALCCVPVGETTLTLGRLEVTSGVKEEARNLALLVAALVATGLASMAIAVLLPILIIATPASIIPIVIAGGASAIVGALVSAGLA